MSNQPEANTRFKVSCCHCTFMYWQQKLRVSGFGRSWSEGDVYYESVALCICFLWQPLCECRSFLSYAIYMCAFLSVVLPTPPFQGVSVMESIGTHRLKLLLLLASQGVLTGILNGVSFLAVAVRAALTVQTWRRVVWIQAGHGQTLKRVLVWTQVIPFCIGWAFQTQVLKNTTTAVLELGGLSTQLPDLKIQEKGLAITIFQQAFLQKIIPAENMSFHGGLKQMTDESAKLNEADRLSLWLKVFWTTKENNAFYNWLNGIYFTSTYLRPCPY